MSRAPYSAPGPWTTGSYVQIGPYRSESVPVCPDGSNQMRPIHGPDPRFSRMPFFRLEHGFPVPNSRPVRSPDLRSLNNLQNKSIGEFRNVVLL